MGSMRTPAAEPNQLRRAVQRLLGACRRRHNPTQLTQQIGTRLDGDHAFSPSRAPLREQSATHGPASASGADDWRNIMLTFEVFLIPVLAGLILVGTCYMHVGARRTQCDRLPGEEPNFYLEFTTSALKATAICRSPPCTRWAYTSKDIATVAWPRRAQQRQDARRTPSLEASIPACTRRTK